MKNLLVIGLAAAAYYLVKRGTEYSTLAQNITTRTSNIRIQTLNFSGIQIAANVEVNNPTNSTCTITKPVVYLTSNGKPIGESNATGSTIQVKAQNVTSLGGFLINIPIATLLQYVSSIKFATIFNAFGSDVAAGGAELIKQFGIPLEMRAILYVDNLMVSTPTIKIA